MNCFNLLHISHDTTVLLLIVADGLYVHVFNTLTNFFFSVFGKIITKTNYYSNVVKVVYLYLYFERLAHGEQSEIRKLGVIKEILNHDQKNLYMYIFLCLKIILNLRWFLITVCVSNLYSENFYFGAV